MQASKTKENLEVGRRLVATLAAEGFDLDADKEALRFSKLDAAGRTERMQEIRSNYRHAPVGGVRIPVEPGVKKQVNGKEARTDGIQDDGHYQRALHYVRENSSTFEEALRQTRTK